MKMYFWKEIENRLINITNALQNLLHTFDFVSFLLPIDMVPGEKMAGINSDYIYQNMSDKKCII